MLATHIGRAFWKYKDKSVLLVPQVSVVLGTADLVKLAKLRK